MGALPACTPYGAIWACRTLQDQPLQIRPLPAHISRKKCNNIPSEDYFCCPGASGGCQGSARRPGICHIDFSPMHGHIMRAGQPFGTTRSPSTSFLLTYYFVPRRFLVFHHASHSPPSAVYGAGAAAGQRQRKQPLVFLDGSRFTRRLPDRTPPAATSSISTLSQLHQLAPAGSIDRRMLHCLQCAVMIACCCSCLDWNRLGMIPWRPACGLTPMLPCSPSSWRPSS